VLEKFADTKLKWLHQLSTEKDQIQFKIYLFSEICIAIVKTISTSRREVLPNKIHCF
jgi:hypothetical protein